jgi:rubrerythrin
MAYSINEIIEIAINIEVRGFEFYTECRDRSADRVTADIFDFLAKEERAHKEKFLSLKNDYAAPDGPLSEEKYRYLKIIGGEKIFETLKVEVGRTRPDFTAPVEAVKKAFILEKDSILFYDEMKQMYGAEREPIELIEKIIAEERKHITILYDLSQKIRLT